MDSTDPWQHHLCAYTYTYVYIYYIKFVSSRRAARHLLNALEISRAGIIPGESLTGEEKKYVILYYP